MLDIGCNDGSRTVDRFAQTDAAAVIGLEYHEKLVEAASVRHGGSCFQFYQMDVEDDRLEQTLQDILARCGASGFDLITLSFVLTHLRQPARLLRRLRPFLSSGGAVVVTDADDGYSALQPDRDGLFAEYLQLCRTDDLMGRRDFGRTLPALLTDCGYTAVQLHSTAVTAGADEPQKKRRMLEAFFSFIEGDIACLLAEQPENETFAAAARWIDRRYDAFHQAIVAEDTAVSCGAVVVSGRK